MKKDWENIIKERLDGDRTELPASDWNDFLSRKSAHERAARRRRILTLAIALPAAAAVVAAVLVTFFLMSFDDKSVAETEILSEDGTGYAEMTEVCDLSNPADADFVELIDDDLESDDLDVEEWPQFPGGTAALLEWLENNMQYPDSCRKNSIQGRVLVTFAVETDSTLSDIRIVKSVSPDLDREAIRLVQSMPKWKPGALRGQPVRAQMTVPIYFRLE